MNKRLMKHALFPKRDTKPDLLDQFSAGSTGRGFTSPTPSRGAGPNRPGKARPWPKPGSMEQKRVAADNGE